ncbi:hypothetical protein PspLS_06572 [Pyricularia sp. CBS 133598]|nr:hypothetical protein PspLS_06566 [Pyricularia sp. CBS 133598]TLD24057.1 hypothetical protein PspLS_06572 [Pyricularia sp. CBS 133598]
MLMQRKRAEARRLDSSRESGANISGRGRRKGAAGAGWGGCRIRKAGNLVVYLGS